MKVWLGGSSPLLSAKKYYACALDKRRVTVAANGSRLHRGNHRGFESHLSDHLGSYRHSTKHAPKSEAACRERH